MSEESHERFDELLKTETAMRRARLVGAGFAALQFALYRPPAGLDMPFSRWWGTVVVAGLLAANVLSLAVSRSLDVRRLRVVGMGGLGVNAAVVLGVVWLFAFDTTSALWALLVLPVLEAARRASLRGALVAWALMAVGYAAREAWASAVYGHPFLPESVSYRCGIVFVVALIAGYMARDLSSRARREREARLETERRAHMLQALAGASRSLTTLNVGVVLDAVVVTATEIGFDAAEVCLFEGDTWRATAAVGLPADYVGRSFPIDSGIAGLVRQERRSVVVSDYSAWDRGVPQVRADGFASVVACPVWSGAEMVAAVIAGTHGARVFSSNEIEALELLAVQTGRGLENARRFEAERATAERLRELDQMKSDFLSTASHELRTPLTVIEGMGLTLQKRWDRLSEAMRREFLAKINANAEALQDLVSRLLDFSRLEEGRLPVRSETVDVRQAAVSVAERLRTLFSPGALRVDAPERLFVTADRILLERVLENLVSNAAKHTPAGTPVMVRARREGASAMVEVRDEGPGIPPDEIERLGERFFRGARTRREGTRGVGLGVALVRELLALQGSRLDIDSQVGHGSRFTFRFPLTPGSAAVDSGRKLDLTTAPR